MLTIVNIFGWIWAHWRVMLAVLGVILLLIGVFWVKSCISRRSAKIDEASIQKINKANEAERKAELQKVITENADVVKTVDDRNTIAAADEANRNAEIYAKIQEADRKIAEAKAKGHDVTGDELECILIPENCK